MMAARAQKIRPIAAGEIQHTLFGAPTPALPAEPASAPAPPPKAHPFFKWVGGKRQLIPAMEPYLPKLEPGAKYHELFLGGGALFFHLAPEAAHLSDMNARLVRTYRAVRDRVDLVIDLLRVYPHDKAFFTELKKRDIDNESDVEVAAWFIYLNRVCFNGLYRVNRAGRFNVPFGKMRNPTICDEPNLRACSKALQGATIEFLDFELGLERAKSGDLVYLDPPYIPVSANSSFTSYTSGGFNDQSQVRLHRAAKRAVERGVHVVLSNSSAPRVREIYSDGFRCIELDAKRSLNCDATKRGAIKELLMVPA